MFWILSDNPYINFENVLIKKYCFSVWYSQNIESCLSKQHTHILYVLKILTFLVQFHQRLSLYNFPGEVKLLLGGYYVIIFTISGRLLLFFSTYYVCTLCCKSIRSSAFLWCKMPMFRRAWMRVGGKPLPLAFQYLIFMV